jgi:hypothetical protein
LAKALPWSPPRFRCFFKPLWRSPFGSWRGVGCLFSCAMPFDCFSLSSLNSYSSRYWCAFVIFAFCNSSFLLLVFPIAGGCFVLQTSMLHEVYLK